MERRALPPPIGGLADLRKVGALSDLLFLYDCTTNDSTRLRPIAERLGVTVQAASHSYRQLARRNLVELRGGRYRPTMKGVAWLHSTLQELASDLFARQQRLPIVRSLRAVAARAIDRGDEVALELVDGVLTARPGRSEGSRGIAASRGAAGSLVAVEHLEGILRIPAASVSILTVAAADLAASGTLAALRKALRSGGPGLVGASGTEAIHLVRAAGVREVVRFAPGASAAEAARVGVSSTIVVLEEELPTLLRELDLAGRPSLTVAPIGGAPRRGQRRANRPDERRRLRRLPRPAGAEPVQ